ncbi:Zona pellucida sperm-binding protein 3 [Larimichthys crocea]|uniref:Uncharacterized protein n=1 Tax=Larimichthys crocea TaxID=215358 RepID=A0ACD3RP59_LARCR|nr:Zona pellucida sperm-binding protein 3 [Larimichthys crocea]
MSPGEIQSDFAYLPDVSVTCSTSDFVVRVKPAFYGLGADADELKLGNTCKITGVLRPYGDLLFTCMLDSKRDPGASQFISRTDKGLRFSLKAFQFTSDPDTEVRIYCNLSVTSEDPSPAHKSCTYRGNRWKALTGDDSICECCDSQCVTSKPRRTMMEGHASSGLLLVSDQPYAAEDGFLPISPHSSISMSREGETTISHYTDDLHSHENQWGNPHVVMYDDDEEEEEVYTDDEEEEQPDEEESGVREELGFRERVWELNQFEEDGSGYIVQEDYSESEEEEELEEGKDEISDVQQVNQKQGEVLEQMLPSDVSLQRELVSEEEEENRKHTVRGKEDDRSIASEEKWKNDDEMTWYFTWR